MNRPKPSIAALFRPQALLIAAVVSLTMALPACRRDNDAEARLDAAERLMESRPDSALLILDSIQAPTLHGESRKARFALLKSIALDKNYIDTTTFDVIQPAIDYYLKKGTPDQRLRTYYYQGRIYQNAGNSHKAVSAFMQGLDNADDCTDSLVMARAFAAQGAEYMEFYDFDNYTGCYLKAAKILNALHREDLEFECLLSALNGTILMKDQEKADSIISLCRQFN